MSSFLKPLLLFFLISSVVSSHNLQQAWINLLAKMAKYHIFWKILAKRHCFGNKWQSTTFSRTRVPHQFCHRGTAELEFVWLKQIMWYSSLVNSSTMQHNARVYQARVPLKKKKNYTVLKFGKLDYCVIFFFFFLG